MTDEVLQHLIKSYLSLRQPQSSFAWQGGEPSLMGLDFYKRVIELQQKFGAPSQVVSNSFQTNGILLDDDWCRFFRRYKWLVGISLDGPKELHDHYRKNAGGEGSFDKVMCAIEACRRNNVEFNILTLITDRNCNKANELFDFYVKNRYEFVQHIPSATAGYSPQQEEFGRFLCRFFDLWYMQAIEWMRVRLFDSLILHILDNGHFDCTFGTRCDEYIAVEHNGDVYPCDFFVEEAWRLGNLMETPIEKLAASPLRQDFAARKRKKSDKCLICRWNELCCGGCPKDRLAAGSWTEPSCFCQAYKMFFEHAMSRLTAIAAEMAR